MDYLIFHVTKVVKKAKNRGENNFPNIAVQGKHRALFAVQLAVDLLEKMRLCGIAPLRGAFPKQCSPLQIALRLFGVIGIQPLRGCPCHKTN